MSIWEFMLIMSVGFAGFVFGCLVIIFVDKFRRS